MITKTIGVNKQARQAVNDRDGARAPLCRAAGIHEAALSRFMTGERGLSVPSLDALAGALGLQLVLRPKRRPKKGRQR